MKNIIKKITKIMAVILVMVVLMPTNNVAAASRSYNINRTFDGTLINYLTIETARNTTLEFSTVKGKVRFPAGRLGLTDGSTQTLDSDQPYIVRVYEITNKGEKLIDSFSYTTNAKVKLKANKYYRIVVTPHTKDQTFNWIKNKTPYFKWNMGYCCNKDNTYWKKTNLPKIRIKINNISWEYYNYKGPQKGSTLGIK